jgi:polar amino acid transport system substrate-binding protein
MKKLTITILAAATVLALSACSAQPSAKSGGASGSGSSSSGVIAQIKASGQINIADCLSFKPFGFYDASGKPSGYDVDLAQLLAKSLGVKANIVNVTADNRIPYLQTGKVDAVFCNFTITGQRAQAVDFTIPYVISGEGILVRKSAHINGPSDLNGKTVAVTKGSTNAQEVATVAPHAVVQAYNDDTSAMQAVKTGQADAFIEDLNFLTYQASQNSSLDVLKTTLGAKEYNGWGVKKGDKALLDYLNSFLRRATEDGQSLTLFKKWFGASPLYPLSYTTSDPTSGLDLVSNAESSKG